MYCCSSTLSFSKYLSYFIGKVSVSSVPSHPTDRVRWDTPLGSHGTVNTICVFNNRKPGSIEYCKKC